MNLLSPSRSLRKLHPRHTRSTAAAFVLMLMTLGANADPISIPNASFESPSSPANSSSNPNLIPGWIFNVSGGSQFGTMAISPSFASPGASSGSEAAFINNDAVNVTDTITSASSLATIAPLTQYTLTLAIGNVNQNDSSLYGSPGNVSFSLLANGVAIATKQVLNGTVPNGTFEQFALSFTSAASGSLIDENLTIQMATLPQQGSAYKPAFDNIVLDATPLDPPSTVPEPQSWALLLISLGVLSPYLLRRHAPKRGIRPESRLALALIALAISALSAHATPITIPNASFENPTTPTGGDGAPIPGWIFNSQSGNLYGTSLIANAFTSEGAASGNNYAWMFNDVAGDTDTITSAASLGIIAPNTLYTLTLAVGNVGGSDSVSNHSPGNVSFSLLANGIAFATDTVPNGTVPDGTFEDFSLTFQTPSFGSIIGENLEIQLASLPTSGPGSGPAFDNVTLDATTIAVPEPPALYMCVVALGALALCLIRRHQIQ